MLVTRMMSFSGRFTVSLFIVATMSHGAWGASVIQDTRSELIAAADLNNDGRQDVVLVDKATGRVRPGYAQTNGLFLWTDWRDSGTRGVTGMTVGRLFDEDHDGLAFASQDGNQLTRLDLSDPLTARTPEEIPFLLLGPACVVALNTGHEGKAGLHDLFVGSVYNSPDPNVASLFLNTGTAMEAAAADVPLPGAPAWANRVQLKDGGPECLALVLQAASDTSFQIQSWAEGRPVSVASVGDLEPGVQYTVAKIRGLPLRDLLFWTPGARTLVHRPILEPSPGRYAVGEAHTQDLAAPIQSVVPLSDEMPGRLFVIQDGGRDAGLYWMNENGTAQLTQTLRPPPDHLFAGALPAAGGFVAFQCFTNRGSSVRYQFFKEADGQVEEDVYGRLPTLADNDKLTLPDLHARIVEVNRIHSIADMQAYTNTVPGTRVTYVMVPIPGGEFAMGSPETESGRKPDEGPIHRVQLGPFWMGKFEVTWQEFELFMQPDTEKKLREINPTDEIGDALADAITHPSKPYTDMTFGMGRDGYPAIAMTQHGANKYCQWLSAKTGHFYRLPTEAEWEYAARAGTSTAYFFGDDASALSEYAWYESNSDFKYQKVGCKKPNPWGLHDIYGNVVEWVLDQYDPRFYTVCAGRGRVVDPWNKATLPYPHSVRGGSWDDSPEACRSAARRGSDPAWKLKDPQLPKSIWYLTDADFVGFRLVRPLGVPSSEEMLAFWYSGVERE